MSTHQQLIYHIVFSTKKRKYFLQEDEFRERVFRYLSGIVKSLGGFPIQVGGYFDHVHLLVKIPATEPVSSFVGKVKAGCSRWINQKTLFGIKFEWQDGFGAFTVSSSGVARVVRYIKNQLQHHQEWSFQNEYLTLLERHGVEYDPKFVFD